MRRFIITIALLIAAEIAATAVLFGVAWIFDETPTGMLAGLVIGVGIVVPVLRTRGRSPGTRVLAAMGGFAFGLLWILLMVLVVAILAANDMAIG